MNKVRRYLLASITDSEPEIKNLIEPLSSNQGLTGTAFYQILTGRQYPSYPPDKAYVVFNGKNPIIWDDVNRYDALIVQWSYDGGTYHQCDYRVCYNFNTPKTVKEADFYTVTKPWAGVEGADKWKVVYSDNGTNWYDCFSWKNINPMTTGINKYTEKVNTGAHKYWGIEVYGSYKEFIATSGVYFRGY